MGEPGNQNSGQFDSRKVFSHEEMISLHAEHELISTNQFRSREEFTLHLIHSAAYFMAARLTAGKKVLDLGCNTGYGTNILSYTCHDVVGVDVSDKAIITAKDKYRNHNIEFMIIDGKSLSFDGGTFDAVVSFQVIEHIVDYSIFINEIKRALKPEGIVIFTTPNALLRLDPEMKPWNRFHVREFDHKSLRLLLETYFRYTDIFGLFAEEPYYSIEVNRLAKSREQAREGYQKKRTSYDILKDILPQKAVDIMENVRYHLSFKLRGELRKLMNNNKQDDFYYRQTDLESALDLMAICCNDNTIFNAIRI